MPHPLQPRLDQAEAEYHKLMLGKSARVVVDGNNGTRVEYTAANRAALYSYIQSLRSEINPTVGVPANGPAGFIF